MTNVIVGCKTYGPIEILYDNGVAKINIGNYCSIAKNVKFFLGGNHNYKRISTWPFQSCIYHRGSASRDASLDIIIEDDVWLGYDCIVLPGAWIGKGSVIGARSVVTGVVPPYSVYVVTKVIKKRFSDDIISQLQCIDFSNINHRPDDAYALHCTSEVNPDNVKIIKQAFTAK